MARGASGSDLEFRMNLRTALDPAGMRETQAMLDRMAKSANKIEIGVDDSQLRAFAARVAGLGKDLKKAKVGEAVLAGVDREFEGLFKKFESAQTAYTRAISRGDEVEADLFREELAGVNRDMARLEAAAKGRADMHGKSGYFGGAGGAQGAVEGGKGLADGFTSALNNLKGGDIAGFASTLGGGVVKGLQGRAKAKSLAAAAETDPAAAEAMAKSAATMATVAVVVAGVAAAVGLVIAAIMAVDGQAKEFNKTLMEGGGIADFTFDEMKGGLVDVETTLDSARDASIAMVDQFRGDAKEYVAVLGQLNAAGLKYSDMSQDAATKTEDFQSYLKTATVASKTFGTSMTEIASVMGEQYQAFGYSNTQLEEGFARVAGAAQQSKMGTKAFFTAVSQASSGMALYNVHMADAAQLLASTSKILGGMDASEFIKTLSKGFVDEGMTDRMKRIMIAGAPMMGEVFESEALRAAEAFRADMSANSKGILAGAGIDVSGGADGMVAAMRDMSEEQGRALLTSLRAQGEEAGARQVEAAWDIAKATSGSLDAQTKALDNLSMGGKLAMKMQTLDGKRLSQMSAIELAAFESYAGVSGEALEQLIRMDKGLVGAWERLQGALTGDKPLSPDEAKFLQETYGVNLENGKIQDRTGKEITSLTGMTLTMQDKLGDIAKLQDKAEYFAQTVAENTGGVFDVLKNQVVKLLEGMYSLMQSWPFSGLSESDTEVQKDLLAQNRAGQEASAAEVSALAAKVSASREAMATTGDADGSKQLQLDLDEAQLAREKAKRDALFKQGREIGEGEIYEEAPAWLEGIASVVDIFDDYNLTQLAGFDLGLGDMVRGVGQKTGITGTKDPASITADTTETSTEFLEDMVQGDNKGSKWEKKKKLALEKWQKDYPKETTDAFEAAWRNIRAMETAGELVGKGTLGGTDAKVIAAELANGFQAGNQVDRKIAEMLKSLSPEIQAHAAQSGFVHQDFIMRPGQAPLKFTGADTVVGAKPGGPLAGLGGGGTTVININGADMAKVYTVVRSAIKTAKG